MTKEEAIQYWVDFREEIDEFMDEYWGADDVAEQKEATDMAIAALRDQPRWISVEERLPENNDKVLAFTLSGKYAVARYDQRRRCWIAAGNLTVTHWMPLPDVPEVEV